MIGRRQHDHVVAAIVLIDTDNIEQVHGEGDQVGIVILLFNAFCQCLGFSPPPLGGISSWRSRPCSSCCFQRFMLLAASFDQIVKAFGLIR